MRFKKGELQEQKNEVKEYVEMLDRYLENTDISNKEIIKEKSDNIGHILTFTKMMYPDTDQSELFFSLVFVENEDLKKICKKLGI